MISKWLEFKTGLSYFETGFTTFPETHFNFYFNNGTYQDLSEKTYNNYKFGMINIPVALSFTLFHVKFFSLNTDLGVHPSFVIEHSITKTYYNDINGKYQKEITSLRSSYNYTFGLWTSVGLNVAFTLKRWILGVGYDFKADVFPIIRRQKTGELRRYLYSTGGGLTIGYKL
jgi:hypothetical protein